MPGPARVGQTRGLTAVAENQRCAACHAKEAAEWLGSPHQRATVNPAFRAALAIEPTPFCRGCHAPEADPRVDPQESALRDLGVGCVSCHVTEGDVVLAAPSRDRDRDRQAAGAAAPHPIRRSASFGSEAACAGCHEFAFPPSAGRWSLPLAAEDDAHLMQTTVREHRRSQGRETSCAGCHMTPRAGESGRRSHAFWQTRDPSYLREHVVVSAVREGNEVSVTLRQTTPGHRFPTGDLFRRLEVGAELRDSRGQTVSRVTRHLARHFVLDHERGGRTLAQDDRLADGPVTVGLSLEPPFPEADKYVVYFWVSYQRVATVGEGLDDTSAEVESAVRLREGVLP
jgi:hypothetical protein